MRFHGCFLLEERVKTRSKILERLVFGCEQRYSPGAGAAHQHNVGDEIHGAEKSSRGTLVHKLETQRRAEKDTTYYDAQ